MIIRTLEQELQTSKRRVLGLDTSSKCIGYGLFEGDKLIKYGKYRFETTHQHGQKLLAFYTFLVELFKEVHAHDVVIEMPYRSSAFGVLMWYIGVVLLAHYDVYGKELPKHNMLQSSTIKSYMEVPSGKQHDVNKAIMVKKVNLMFGLKLIFKPNDSYKLISTDDIADGISTAWAFIQREKYLKSNTVRTNIKQLKSKKKKRRWKT